MKKLLVFTVLAAFMLPLVAQTDQSYDPNNRVQVVSGTISKEEVPQSLLKSVNTRFDKSNPLTWSKFPYTLKELGWVYDIGSSDTQLTNYEVTMRTGSGDELWGVYNAEGNLIETREISRNIPLPRYVQVALAESPFSGWTVIGDREIVNFYQGRDKSSAEQQFKLTVKKEKEKKRLAFKYEASTGKYQASVIR